MHAERLNSPKCEAHCNLASISGVAVSCFAAHQPECEWQRCSWAPAATNEDCKLVHRSWSRETAVHGAYEDAQDRERWNTLGSSFLAKGAAKERRCHDQVTNTCALTTARRAGGKNELPGRIGTETPTFPE